MEYHDAEAAVREVLRIVSAPSNEANPTAATAHTDMPVARVDIAGVLARIRTPEFGVEYRQLEASTLALQTKADQQLATLHSLERADAPDREVAAAGRELGRTEYAYDYECWRLRMKALTALAGPPSPAACGTIRTKTWSSSLQTSRSVCRRPQRKAQVGSRLPTSGLLHHLSDHLPTREIGQRRKKRSGKARHPDDRNGNCHGAVSPAPAARSRRRPETHDPRRRSRGRRAELTRGLHRWSHGGP